MRGIIEAAGITTWAVVMPTDSRLVGPWRAIVQGNDTTGHSQNEFNPSQRLTPSVTMNVMMNSVYVTTVVNGNIKKYIKGVCGLIYWSKLIFHSMKGEESHPRLMTSVTVARKTVQVKIKISY